MDVHELSLARFPDVFTPLLFVCKPKKNSECLGRTSHTSRSCCRGPNVAMSSECLLKSSLNPRSKSASQVPQSHRRV